MKDEVLKLLSDHPGSVPVVIYDADQKKQYRLQGAGVNPDPELIESLHHFLGNENVVMSELS